jgi:hypothetical protein
MESNMRKADILTRPKKLCESLLKAAAWLVFLPLSYILCTLKAQVFEVASF